MFSKKPDCEPIDEVIDSALFETKAHDATSDEFAAIVDQLTKLYKIKADSRPDRVSKDTLAIVAANLFGIFIMLQHERAHIITSKVLAFIIKPR